MPTLVPPRSVRGYSAVAVTPHELSTAAAIELIHAGGNAVDAAIAANAVQGVVAPETCGIGGDLFALVHRPDMSQPLCLNASGRAGSGASAAVLREAGESTMPLYGPHSITVPGCVDGWLALHGELGTAPFERVLAPAMRHATNGFPASRELVGSWTRNADQLLTQPSAAPMFPGGAPPADGTRIHRPLLAESLEAVLTGRDAYYIDRIGSAVVDATDGSITLDDMGRDQAEWVDPLGTELFGQTSWTVPPNTQGYLTHATLAIFEQLQAPDDPEDPAYHHALIEAYRSVAWERDDLVADPDRAPMDPGQLLDIGRLSARVDAIDADRAGAWRAPTAVPGGTAYLCVIDGEGMGVSLIQSNYHGIGSGMSAGDTGVWLHNRGGGFNLIPGHPNELMPGQRPLHTLSPTLWTDAGRLSMILGTRGGHHQPQLLAQLAALRLHCGLDLAEAQAAPRWAIDELDAPESKLRVEDRMASAATVGLESRGHAIERNEPWMGGWGPISVIEIDRDDRRDGAADPRVDTALAAAV